MDTSPAKPCNHCGTIDPRKPRSLDRDDNPRRERNPDRADGTRRRSLVLDSMDSLARLDDVSVGRPINSLQKYLISLDNITH